MEFVLLIHIVFVQLDKALELYLNSMIILNKKMSIKEVIEYDDKEYFPEDKMVKAVADVTDRS